jgi:hypothetical protein
MPIRTFKSCPGQKPHPSENHDGRLSIDHGINYLEVFAICLAMGAVTLDICVV